MKYRNLYSSIICSMSIFFTGSAIAKSSEDANKSHIDNESYVSCCPGPCCPGPEILPQLQTEMTAKEALAYLKEYRAKRAKNLMK